jgi:hypothetical protein
MTIDQATRPAGSVDDPSRIGPLHHPSHTGLLALNVDPPRRAPVDAIIVPSFRPAFVLDHVIRVAEALNAVLLVLCSGLSVARYVVGRAPNRGRVTAIDVASLGGLLPQFETSRLTAPTAFHRPTDTSFKRNLGLLIARVAGWERIVFLDDDIQVPHAADLEYAAGLADANDAVGLRNEGYPDNSVVCHALRKTGGAQGTFVGGGGMVLRPDRAASFFPNIYNEDWFFLLNRWTLGRVGVHGTMLQRAFDPFESPARAATEELGDCLAEGIFWLLDNNLRISHADLKHWTTFLSRRQRLLGHITTGVIRGPFDRDERRRMLASLTAARERNASITPTFCDRYVQAWQRDRRVWRKFLRDHRSQISLENALKEVGVPPHATCTSGTLELTAG